MDVLTLRNLHKAFGRQKVLQGIDLTVPQHSIFGFIGKNGAGKTTTMKTILGLEKAKEKTTVLFSTHIQMCIRDRSIHRQSDMNRISISHPLVTVQGSWRSCEG